jgi:UDP-N-acetylmuramyl pentapeptide phosphotransferase/UDP-N-acetylglucosamine-1-phosphate transferase
MSFTDRLGFTVSQAIAAWVLVFLVGGAAGVIAMLLCHYLLTFGGEDAANKHGISKVSATRLGGVAIVAYILMHLGYQVYLGAYTIGLGQIWLMGICSAFFLLGVYEDLYGSLSARVRFLSMLGIGSASMFLSPNLALQPVGIIWVDMVLGSSLLSAVAFSALCIAFIPNAFNTADGANGLVAGVSAFALAAFSTIASPELVPLILAALVGCLLFLVFNLISGRFFLGDGGAYFLGALCGLSMIWISNNSDVSVWWLLSLVFYPVADLLWSMARRVLRGASPFRPDNQHYHNLLFAYLDSGERSSTASNTLTGVLIAGLFSGLPAILTLLGVWSAQDEIWALWVGCQWLVYGVGWKYLNDRLCVLPRAAEQM